MSIEVPALELASHDAFEDLLPGESAPCTGMQDENDDRITLVGLIFETAYGLRRALLRTIDLELGIAGQSFDILLRLVRSPEAKLRMSDLATQTGLSPSGLTRAIDRLIESGFLERASCPSDRRGAFAMLTPDGRARTEAAMDRHRRDIDAVLDGVLDKADERQLVELLRSVRDRIQPDAATVTDDEPMTS